MAVADVFDALLAKRAYKPAWNISDVLQYMKDQSGAHFDIMIVCLLLAHIDEIMALYK